MRATGYVWRVDRLGRLVVPTPIRQALGITPGTPIAIAVDGEDIVLEKYRPRCVFCGAPTEETVVGKVVCPKGRSGLAAWGRGQRIAGDEPRARSQPYQE
ncbi:MAG TPA: AbrB/MazE/SpoVT family DNA-binding domain-containing protein [Thermaerobacter sp.]